MAPARVRWFTVHIMAFHDIQHPPATALGLRTECSSLLPIRLLTCLLVAAFVVGVTGALPAGAQGAVRSCSQSAQSGSTTIGRILSVRGMTCAAAARYYARHQGDRHVPIAKGKVTHIGTFTCRVYQDLTPPGPSDTWVRIRCSSGQRAFRLEYGV
jgi:hypothetical protein